ncbi:hypothetical protein Anapl_05017 [Anas platyrhynchos]|uniref:Uncharacterized protein n=1 Tax=Anas platyrhynchos TaxID=8839 RepID=R0L702_ANAPL|nr:hypothetical protein Anapl_05017 [Anas platyrhynchos]
MPACSEEGSSAAPCARQPFPRHCCPRLLLLPQPCPLLPLRLANAAEKFQKAHHWQDNIRSEPEGLQRRMLKPPLAVPILLGRHQEHSPDAGMLSRVPHWWHHSGARGRSAVCHTSGTVPGLFGHAGGSQVLGGQARDDTEGPSTVPVTAWGRRCGVPSGAVAGGGAEGWEEDIEYYDSKADTEYVSTVSTVSTPAALRARAPPCDPLWGCPTPLAGLPRGSQAPRRPVISGNQGLKSAPNSSVLPVLPRGLAFARVTHAGGTLGT